mmetsp:Transcript_26553/g.84217  ORF Transcript_26553/g.84217 Transcript_26553/m.84217 type:complete len:206 (-) Transcript_26553:237-854(-)
MVPVMMKSPALRWSPVATRCRASQEREFRGLPSTDAPVPRPTKSPFLLTETEAPGRESSAEASSASVSLLPTTTRPQPPLSATTTGPAGPAPAGGTRRRAVTSMQGATERMAASTAAASRAPPGGRSHPSSTPSSVSTVMPPTPSSEHRTWTCSPSCTGRSQRSKSGPWNGSGSPSAACGPGAVAPIFHPTWRLVSPSPRWTNAD